jgi:hypothetical protein
MLKGKVMMASTKAYTPVIVKIMLLCDFPADAIMVRYIDQLGLKQLEDATTMCFDKAKDFFTVCEDGNFEPRPMLIHLCQFKALLLYFMQRGQELSTIFIKDDVLDMKKIKFKKYCGSANYHAYSATFGLPILTATSPWIDANTNEVIDTTNLLTVQEFQRCVERDRNHYADLKVDMDFINWNHGFIATAHMHHMNEVLDKTYVPLSEINIGIIQENMTFMYAVLEDHLKTNREKSLVCQFKSTVDPQGIYRELKKLALRFNAAQLSADTMLDDIKKTRFTENWFGKANDFVFCI